MTRRLRLAATGDASGDGEPDWEAVTKAARLFTRQGADIAWFRQWGASDPFCALIATEMKIITERRRFRLMRGGARSWGPCRR